MEQEPLFTERETLEGMNTGALVSFVIGHSVRIAESERMIGLANDVLTGYGTSMDLELERLNETNTEVTGT